MTRGVPEVVDQSLRPVKLGSILGRGGEGAVYALSLHADVVAKIYHQPLSPERAAKIAAMVTMRNASLSRLAAWPQGLLSDPSGRPVGLTMPRIDGHKDIHHLYSPKSRRNDFQRADWRFLVRAAGNTARAFAAVHDAGCVIGDVNHGGVLVSQNATVKLIDCDSFQVSHDGRQFFCEVGVETFTPPELQGRSFAGIVRSPNHDNFGLAVMAFLLLFMGRHPFAGRYMGQGDMPIARAIKEFRFAYGTQHRQLQMAPPPGTPDLNIVGPEVAALFEAAFRREAIGGGRPTAKRWIEAISDLESGLTQCASNPAHWHSRTVACPWCQMEGATGVPLFAVAIPDRDVNLFDFTSLWRQVTSIPHPGAAPTIEIPTVKPSKAAAAAHRRRVAGVAISSLGAVGLVIAGLNGAGAWAFVAAVAFFFACRKAFRAKAVLDDIATRRSAAHSRWTALSSAWNAKAGPAAFDACIDNLKELRREYEGGENRRRASLEELKRNHRKIQLDDFLDQFDIADANIPTIGAGRKQTLESYGIETALDITESALSSVPGFGEKTIAKLVQWRIEIERRFVFDPRKPIDPIAFRKVEADHQAWLRSIERKLVHGLAQLQKTNSEILATRLYARGPIEQAAKELAEADADVRAV